MAGLCQVGRGRIFNSTTIGDKPNKKGEKRSQRFNRVVPIAVKELIQERTEEPTVLKFNLRKDDLPVQEIYWLGNGEVLENNKSIFHHVLHHGFQLVARVIEGNFTPFDLLEHLRRYPDSQTYLVEQRDLIRPFVLEIREQMASDGLSCSFVGVDQEGIECVCHYTIDLKMEEAFYDRWTRGITREDLKAGRLHRPIRL